MLNLCRPSNKQQWAAGPEASMLTTVACCPLVTQIFDLPREVILWKRSFLESQKFCHLLGTFRTSDFLAKRRRRRRRRPNISWNLGKAAKVSISTARYRNFWPSVQFDIICYEKTLEFFHKKVRLELYFLPEKSLNESLNLMWCRH